MSHIKALNSPPEPPKWKMAIWRFKWWFEEAIWYNHSPRWLRHLWWDFKSFWYKHVECRIFPKQAWLTRSIPLVWQDKINLIPTVLYAMVIHFVEEEKCFEVTDWAGSGIGEEEKQLKEIYDWVKLGRPAKEYAIKCEYDKIPMNSDEDVISWINRKDEIRERAYKEIDRLEKEMDEWDTRCLTWLVVNRGHLWT
jgi:hypothetical protein